MSCGAGEAVQTLGNTGDGCDCAHANSCLWLSLAATGLRAFEVGGRPVKRVGVCAFLVRCSLSCARRLFLHLEQAVVQITRTSPCSPLSCQEPALPPPTLVGIKLGLCCQYCENGVQVIISSVWWLDAANKQLRRNGQPDTTQDGGSPNGTRSGCVDSHVHTHVHAHSATSTTPGGRGHPLLSTVVVTRWPCCLEYSRAAQSIDGHRRMYGVLFSDLGIYSVSYSLPVI